MPKKLSQMTTAEVKESLSIAGQPEAAMEVMSVVFDAITTLIDVKNIPSLDNVQFVLQRVIAELKQWEKMERKRQHP